MGKGGGRWVVYIGLLTTMTANSKCWKNPVSTQSWECCHALSSERENIRDQWKSQKTYIMVMQWINSLWLGGYLYANGLRRRFCGRPLRKTNYECSLHNSITFFSLDITLSVSEVHYWNKKINFFHKTVSQKQHHHTPATPPPPLNRKKLLQEKGVNIW